ncbi:MAG: DUF4124 domain-containing protein [Gammaproteobacteria bacterium]|jgi:hypothetical protein|nr:DUF4124 domain-containing protein [Gammaproteobacteria bacterium]MDH5170884.1 DUF4124 domain-containing protein [Gammaproteobacteria bacterium]
MRILLLLVLLLPQLAAARVFICVDPVTGKKSFSDKGCVATQSQEEMKVGATNVTSGSRTAQAAPAGTWTSDRDTRKTGRDYNAEDALLRNEATASTDAVAANDGS